MTNSEHIPNGQVSEARLRKLIDECTQAEGVSIGGWRFKSDYVSFSDFKDIASLALDALTRRSSAGVKGLETAIAQAYVRGVEWRDENPGHVDFAYRFKAAGDYADKTVAALSSPSHIGEGEPVAWRYSSGWVTGADMVKLWLHTADPVLAAKEATSGNAVQPLYLRPSPSVPPQGETSEPDIANLRDRSLDLKALAAASNAFGYASQDLGDYVRLQIAIAAYLALTPSPTLEPTDAEVERATQLRLDPVALEQAIVTTWGQWERAQQEKDQK